MVSGVLGALVVYYLAVTRWIDAGVWLGIVVNCMTIASMAVAAVRRGATDYGSLPMRRREFRARVGRDHPRLVRRTTVLVTITFIPFLLSLLVIVDPDRARSPSSA